MIDVHAFVQVYNFCHDGGGIYTPTDRDKAMLEDAINCYIAECEQSKPHLEGCPAGDFGPCDCPLPNGER